MTTPVNTTFTDNLTTIDAEWLNYVNNKANQTVHVEDYGAVGSGNETVEIQAALDAHRKVSFSDVAYTTSTAITLRNNHDIMGVAPDRIATTLGTKITSSATVGIDATGSVSNVKINGFRINPSTTRPAASKGIDGTAHVYLNLSDISMDGWETGVYLDESQSSNFKNIRILNSKDGIVFYADGAAGHSFNNMCIMDTVISAASLRHNLDWNGQGLTARNCDFSSGASTAGDTGIKASVRIRKGTNNVFGTSANFDGCYMEGVETGAYAFHNSGGQTHIKNQFIAGGNSAPAEMAGIVYADGGTVFIHSLYGYGYFTNLVYATGSDTTVYLMPGCMDNAGSMIFSGAQIVTASGAKVIDLRSEEGSFSAVLTGVSGGAGATATVKYQKIGKQVTMFFPGSWADTSTTTAMTFTGLPASLYPTTTQWQMCMVLDNGSSFYGQISVGTGGTVSFTKAIDRGTTLFTNSGLKGILTQTVTYNLY